MKEYIEREEAERVAMYVAVEKDHAKELIQRIPAADVAEVRHGKWVCLEAEIGFFACSECDHTILRAKCNYCPNCGAKMDKEE